VRVSLDSTVHAGCHCRARETCVQPLARHFRSSGALTLSRSNFVIVSLSLPSASSFCMQGTPPLPLYAALGAGDVVRARPEAPF